MAQTVPANDLPSNIVPSDDLPAASAPVSNAPLPTTATGWQPFDGSIQKYSAQLKLDPNLLRAVVAQEDSSGDPQARSAAGAIGPGQLMPDTARGLGVDPTDPDANIKGAAILLSRLIKSNGGDVKRALSEYNSGNPNGYLSDAAGYDETRSYVPSVLARYDIVKKQTQPVSADLVPAGDLPAALQQVKHDTKKVTRNLSHGQPVGAALAKTKTLRPLAKEVQNARIAWEGIKEHPVTALLNTLSAGQHAVGAVADAIEHHQDAKRTLMQVSHDVFHPDAHSLMRDTESIRALVHAPTHQALDQAIDQHIQSPALRAVLKPVVKGAEDMGLQTISDPTTFIGGRLAEGAIGAAAKALKAAHASGMGPAFEHLQPVVEGWNKVFGSRPELNKIFTSKGKKLRIAIENSEISAAAPHEAEDARAINAGRNAVKNRTLVYAQAAKQLGIKNIGLKGALSASKEEQKKILADALNKIVAKKIAKRSAQIFKQNPGELTAQIKDWSKIYHQPAPLIKAPGPYLNYLMAPLKLVGKLGKQAVMLNPLPHGIKNVGELAYLAGGPGVVPRAMKHMVTGLPTDSRDRLSRIGALPQYLTHREQAGIFRLPQESMERMEEGWRQALLDVMDKKLGPSKTEADELMKGYLVNDKIGDYRNQSAFVQAFHELGGPFVAFRLGIVPKKVLEALTHDPQRVEALLRSQEDLQADRSHHGQRTNEVTFGGPAEDFANMAVSSVNALSLGALGKPSYYTSPSTLGILGRFFPATEEGQAPSEAAAQMLRALVPGVSELQDIANLAEGTTMEGPGKTHQRMSWADQMAMAFLYSMGGYMHRQKTSKQEHVTKRKIQKEGL